jgi:agmatine deiminase
MKPAPTPKQLGFRMPAEWEPHEATWIAWPHNKDDWPGRFAPIPWVYCEIVRKLAEVEKVRVLVQDGDSVRRAQRMLRKCGANLHNVEFFPIPTNRVWTRDYAPLFLTDAAGETAITNWIFNAWAKYDDWTLDNAVNAQLIERLKFRAWEPGLVLEGGSIDVNGAGVLMTTEECLLSPIQARNPHLTRSEVEKALGDYLGIEKILWLKDGIVGDDTHGHIDDLARFVAPDTIVVAAESSEADENFQILKRNREILDDQPFRVVELPMPSPVMFEGRRLPASYANFYIANELVLVPTFNDPNDRVALDTLASLFPTRTVTGIHAVELAWGLGTLHCLTQQQPA